MTPGTGLEWSPVVTGDGATLAFVRGDVPAPPIAHTLDFELTEVGDGEATFAMTPAEFHYNPIGVVHGGYAMTLLDSTLGVAVHAHRPRRRARMHVGLATVFQNPKKSRADLDVYRNELRLADLGEPLGFESIWGVEHHFTDYTMCPDVIQFLTYMAGRTQRAQLGSMVVVLPWHDPMRAAEEIAMLDNISDGRLILGLGRGAGKVEFDGFRLPMDESRQRFVESATLLLQGLEQGWCEHDGTLIRQITNVTLPPLAISACAAQKPVLFSNAHLTSVGSPVSERDIDECITKAKAGSEAAPSTDSPKESPLAGAATSSVVGAAAGGAGGAIVCNAGQGAAAGAVAGAVGSLMYALLQGRLFERKPPEPITRQLTERCLREKGYDPVGWK